MEKMISETLFYAVGLVGIYLLYRIIKRQFIKGKCSGCSASDHCNKKDCK